MKKILITENISRAGIDFLREKGYEVCFPGGTSEEELVRAVADCEGLIVRIAPKQHATSSTPAPTTRPHTMADSAIVPYPCIIHTGISM